MPAGANLFISGLSDFSNAAPGLDRGGASSDCFKNEKRVMWFRRNRRTFTGKTQNLHLRANLPSGYNEYRRTKIAPEKRRFFVCRKAT
jgi:hypothetical protein